MNTQAQYHQTQGILYLQLNMNTQAQYPQTQDIGTIPAAKHEYTGSVSPDTRSRTFALSDSLQISIDSPAVSTPFLPALVTK